MVFAVVVGFALLRCGCVRDSLPTVAMEGEGLPAYCCHGGRGTPCLPLPCRERDSLPTVAMEGEGLPAHRCHGGRGTPCPPLPWRERDSLPAVAMEGEGLPACRFHGGRGTPYLPLPWRDRDSLPAVAMEGKGLPAYRCHGGRGSDLVNSVVTAAGKYGLHPMASLIAVFGTCQYHVYSSKRNVPLSETAVWMGYSSVISHYCNDWHCWHILLLVTGEASHPQ